MKDLLRSVPKTEQVCPMCRAQLPAGALYCESCGTDLSRAGVLFSTSVRPVSHRRWAADRHVRMAALGAGGLAVLLVLLVGLGSLPAVSARVPAIMTIAAPIRGALNQAVAWGASVMGRGAQDAPAEPETTAAPQEPPPPVTPYLVVKSTPEGADVFLNAERIGRTPVTVYNLTPGTYMLRVTMNGYAPASRRLELQPEAGATVVLQLRPPQASPPAGRRSAQPAPGTQPAPGQASPAQTGALAPGFTLKDRVGVIYRLSDFRGHRLTILFVWSLDDAGRRAVRALNARAAPRSALVILINPDRALVRRVVEQDGITVPILFGSPQLAWEYKVPEGVPVLFTLSEQGHIAARQVQR